MYWLRQKNVLSYYSFKQMVQQLSWIEQRPSKPWVGRSSRLWITKKNLFLTGSFVLLFYFCTFFVFFCIHNFSSIFLSSIYLFFLLLYLKQIGISKLWYFYFFSRILSNSHQKCRWLMLAKLSKINYNNFVILLKGGIYDEEK